MVQVWVVPQETCANRYSELNFTITDNMVCAGWLDVGLRAQCQVSPHIQASTKTEIVWSNCISIWYSVALIWYCTKQRVVKLFLPRSLTLHCEVAP